MTLGFESLGKPSVEVGQRGLRETVPWCSLQLAESPIDKAVTTRLAGTLKKAYPYRVRLKIGSDQRERSVISGM